MFDPKAAWFDEENEAQAATKMVALISALRTDELSTYRKNAHFYRMLYAGTQNITGTMNNVAVTAPKVRYNLVKSAVDTGVSILSAAKTLPFYDTRGGDYEQREKAQNCNQTIQQQFQDIKVFANSQQVIRDALVMGLGVLKFYEDPNKSGGKVSCERTPPLSLVFDPVEAANGSPPNIYQVRPACKDTWKALYPQHADAIEKADGLSQEDQDDFGVETAKSAGQFLVYEGWHLPTSAEEPDGLHIIAINGVVFFSETWEAPRFPFAILHGWQPNQEGFVGESLAMQAEPGQVRILELEERVTALQKLASNAYVFLYDTGKVEPEQVTNSPLKIYRVSGAPGAQPPQFMKFEATPMDLQDQRERIKNETFSMLGLNQTQVHGEKPAGANSAPALRAVEDIQSKRHVQMLRYVEAYYLEAAQALVDTNNRIAKNKPAFAVNKKNRKNFIEQTKWLSTRLKDEDVRLAVLPVSALVGSPSAQFDQATEWVNQGWTDMSTAKMLSGMPDIEGQENVDNEDTTFSYDMITDIRAGQLVSLDPYLNPKVFAKLARTEYLRAKRENAPDPILNEFRRLLELAKKAIEDAEAATAAQMQAAQGAAPGLPA